jgi:hypothetical protein
VRTLFYLRLEVNRLNHASPTGKPGFRQAAAANSGALRRTNSITLIVRNGHHARLRRGIAGVVADTNGNCVLTPI